MRESQFEKMCRSLKEKDAEIERLNELVEAGKEDRKAIDELVDENRRLRELLEKAVVYSHSMPTTLVAAIEKEVGDE
jgi:cell shape-determining protein MreC